MNFITSVDSFLSLNLVDFVTIIPVLIYLVIINYLFIEFTVKEIVYINNHIQLFQFFIIVFPFLYFVNRKFIEFFLKLKIFHIVLFISFFLNLRQPKK